MRTTLGSSFERMCSEPSLVLPRLWVGGSDAVADDSFFKAQGITAVLSIGHAAPPTCVPLKSRKHLKLADLPSSPLSYHFEEVVRFIITSRHKQRGVVYVHCSLGRSRSVACTCAYLMCHLGLSDEEALIHLASTRNVNPNSGFRQQLAAFRYSKRIDVLAKEMAAVPGYHSLRTCDMQKVTRNTPPSPGDGVENLANAASTQIITNLSGSLKSTCITVHKKGINRLRLEAVKARAKVLKGFTKKDQSMKLLWTA